MSTSLHGDNLVATERSRQSGRRFSAENPATGERLAPEFAAAAPMEIETALQGAEEAFHFNRRRSPEDVALLLEWIAEEVEALGEVLVERVVLETALGEGRVRSERARTTGQLRMFADLIREGSWVDARIDRAQPDRTPLPKPGIRRMLIPLGPVVVFGASNFPLAFSVAGGDTASALAAGCPVIVKAHPAHPGTSELVGEAVVRAVTRLDFHPGTFSLIHGIDPDTSIELVTHPLTRAVGFTGSHRAGRAIFDAAAARPSPIPVYAEMGSINPVFLLPSAVRERAAEIAEGFSASVTLGGGQFCTNPGIVVGIANGGLVSFTELAANRVTSTPACALLHAGIRKAYEEGLKELAAIEGVTLVASGEAPDDTAAPAVFSTVARTFLANDRLHEEVFGPSTVIVGCESREDMLRIAHGLQGNLTASIHGTEDDLASHRELVEVLEQKVGRIIFNGFPTGVEVCASMHHGGPYPATTDVRSTSVGTAAIERFARPVCYQNFPQNALPPELRDENTRGIWRLIDNRLTKDNVTA